MDLKPLWTEQSPRPEDLPVSSSLPEKVDVAVVGAGYTGLNCARVLSKRGARVAVLEQNFVGWGASSRNGGMATPGIKQNISTIFKWFGKELGRQFWQASLDAIDLLDRLVMEEGLNCDWARNGHIALAYKASHLKAMREKADWFSRELGHKVKVVERADLRTEIGTDSFYGGLADEYSGGLDPAKYVFELARVVANYGATLCENSKVTDIEKNGLGYQLRVNGRAIKAREVVLATNGYTKRLIPELDRRIFPVGSYIIVTEPLPEDLQRELSPKGRMFYDSKRFLNYFRLTPDGRMLWGGRNNLRTNLNLIKSAVNLRSQLVGVFPELRGVKITNSWTGQLGLTFDLMPHIGNFDGIHYALGYGGHGLSIGTYVGTELGLLMCGDKKHSPFSEIPFNTRFFYRGRPWFIPLAAMYYRLLDLIS